MSCDCPHAVKWSIRTRYFTVYIESLHCCSLILNLQPFCNCHVAGEGLVGGGEEGRRAELEGVDLPLITAQQKTEVLMRSSKL